MTRITGFELLKIQWRPIHPDRSKFLTHLGVIGYKEKLIASFSFDGTKRLAQVTQRSVAPIGVVCTSFGCLNKWCGLYLLINDSF